MGELLKKEKEDRRARRTKRLIREAFFRLIEKKAVSAISITELCDLADINRSSFYAHYEDIFHLQAALEKETAEVFLLQFDTLFKQDDYPVVIMNNILRILEENRECQLLISANPGGNEIMRRVTEEVYQVAMPNWLNHSDITREQADMLYLYIRDGAGSVISAWVQSSCTMPREQLADLLVGVITHGLYHYVYTK